MPAEVGRHRGYALELSYVCSDVCPDAGGLSLSYTGVAESQCCGIGGEPSYDPAWGGYLGCSPRVGDTTLCEE